MTGPPTIIKTLLSAEKTAAGTTLVFNYKGMSQMGTPTEMTAQIMIPNSGAMQCTPMPMQLLGVIRDKAVSKVVIKSQQGPVLANATFDAMGMLTGIDPANQIPLMAAIGPIIGPFNGADQGRGV